MEEIFVIEFHPVDSAPRRARYLLRPDDRQILRQVQQKIDGQWREVDSDVIDYFEYSDES